MATDLRASPIDVIECRRAFQLSRHRDAGALDRTMYLGFNEIDPDTMLPGSELTFVPKNTGPKRKRVNRSKGTR